MKRSGCKTVISVLVVQFVLLLSFSAFAEDVDKKFNKEFSVDGMEMLKINNRYGEVIVQNWDENKVVIEVLVTVKYPSLDKAEKYLSMIDIEFSNNDNTIGATTKLDRNFSFKGGADRNFSIDYLVKMPTDFNLNLTNKYGKVEVGELSGHVQLAVKYGSLFVGKLSRGKEKPLNSVVLSYGNAEIAECGWTELTLRYADRVSVGTAKALLVDSKHSKLYVDEVSTIVANSRYDHIEVAVVTNVVAEGAYTGFEIETLKGKLDVKTGYGSIKVEEIMNGFDMVDIETKYCKVNLGFDDEAAYMLNVESSYASVFFDEDNAEILKRIQEKSRKTIEARMGNGNSESKVKIKANYGSVRVD
jgi:hypothetical protein